MATFIGTNAQDIQTTDYDVLYGGDGNDILASDQAGLSFIEGGRGNDYVYIDPVRNGTGYLYGGDGDDAVAGATGNDHLYGGDGNDLIIGSTYIVYLAGIRPDGRISGDDYLDGGIGSDALYGFEGNDILLGGDGDDKGTISFTGFYAGFPFAAGLYGGAGVDYLDGGRGSDYLDGGAGNDALFGGDDNDELHGASEDDFLDGGRGDDVLFGETGSDNIYGGIGNDNIDGGTETDGLYGGDGDDFIVGGAGNSYDFLDGGAGNDFLYGGAGSDGLVGGTGIDSFYFYLGTVAEGNDYIVDFEHGVDRLYLDDFAGLGQLQLGYNFTVNTSAVQNVATIIYDTNGFLYFDADGTGAGGAVQFATFENRPTLAVSDFVVI